MTTSTDTRRLPPTPINGLDDRWLSVYEAAAYTGLSRDVLDREMAADPGLPYVQLGSRTRRILKSDIDKWLLAGGWKSDEKALA